MNHLAVFCQFQWFNTIHAGHQRLASILGQSLHPLFAFQVPTIFQTQIGLGDNPRITWFASEANPLAVLDSLLRECERFFTPQAGRP